MTITQATTCRMNKRKSTVYCRSLKHSVRLFSFVHYAATLKAHVTHLVIVEATGTYTTVLESVLMAL